MTISECRSSLRGHPLNRTSKLIGHRVKCFKLKNALPIFMHPQPDTQFSVEAIRSQFPALERVHNGFPVAYFDGPGGPQVPRSVVERMSDYLYHHSANTHWNYETSHETDRLIDDAREAFADFLNAS